MKKIEKKVRFGAFAAARTYYQIASSCKFETRGLKGQETNLLIFLTSFSLGDITSTRHLSLRSSYVAVLFFTQSDKVLFI